MIVTCPLCATRYEADTEAFEPEGRKVRCTNCSHTWFQESESAEQARLLMETSFEDEVSAEKFAGDDADITDIETEAARLASASRMASAGFDAKHSQRRRNAYGWMSLAACVMLFVVGGYQFQVPIVKAFPAAARLYAELGIDVNTRGLAFHNVSYSQEFENGIPVIAIRGDIVNITDQPMVVPRLRFGLLDEAAQEIYHWNIKVSQKPLAPNDSLRFSSRLASPPVAARNLQVRLAPPRQ